MDIQKTPSGKIITTLTGYKAFVPHALPPKFEWNTNLVSALSKADHVLGMLAREGSRLPNPYILIRPLLQEKLFFPVRLKELKQL